jgi:hypothetical protein
VIGVVAWLVDQWRQTNAPRLDNIYGPLHAILLTTHITTCSSIGAPRFRQRLQNAIEILDEIKNRRRAWKLAFLALFDKRRSGPSGEVEYGPDLPRSKIISIIKKNEKYADIKLLNLIRRMDRATYEEPQSDNRLSDADLDLCNYIYKEYSTMKYWLAWLS